jgi:hypothetical protein
LQRAYKNVIIYTWAGEKPNKKLEANNMTKIEMELKFAQEIYELDEEKDQLEDELKQARRDEDAEHANRLRRFKSKVIAKRKQTFKMAEAIGLDSNYINNLAFDIAVTKANQEPLGIDLEKCLPF